MNRFLADLGYASVGVLAFLIGGAVRLGRMVRRG